MLIRCSLVVGLLCTGSVFGADAPVRSGADKAVVSGIQSGGGIAAGSFDIETELVASGLTWPTFVVAPPGDFDRLFICEKPGRIRILDLNTGVLQSTGNAFLDIQTTVGGGNSTNDERGLLGMAFHPDYANNRTYYLNYTNNSSDTVVAAFQAQAGDPDSSETTGTTILTIDQPQTNHNGGWIGFGPDDGYLYIATGDGGNFNDQGTGHSAGGNAQDITNNLLGKMLRLAVTPGSGGYTVPGDNPFVDVSGDDEIWAYGLRNPWRNSFDRDTGDLWIGDVGQFSWEEIDFQPASSTGGENYEWRCTEGLHCTGLSGCTCMTGTGPIQEYSHGGGNCSITGGYVYRGSAIPALQGTYFYGDWCTARIWSFNYDGLNVLNFTERTSELNPPGADTIIQLSSFGEDAAGELYIVEHAGAVYKIVPGPLANDECLGAILTLDEETPFSTVGGGTDGFTETGCVFENDVWFRYASDCESDLHISVCDADFDTTLAVYTVCPSGNNQAADCNDDDCGTGSAVTIPAGGLVYIRIGSPDGGTGTGTLKVVCTCLGDGDNDGEVGTTDLLGLLAVWGTADADYDLDNSGTVGTPDLLAMLALWGPC